MNKKGYIIDLEVFDTGIMVTLFRFLKFGTNGEISSNNFYSILIFGIGDFQTGITIFWNRERVTDLLKIGSFNFISEWGPTTIIYVCLWKFETRLNIRWIVKEQKVIGD